MSESSVDSNWWNVVKTVAALGTTFDTTSNDNPALKLLLQNQGFRESDIVKALDWLDVVQRTGAHSECLAMIDRTKSQVRLSHLFEEYYISDEIWNCLMMCRARGYISDQVIEYILDGMRTFDTNDWDEHEVKELIIEILIATGAPGTSEMTYRNIINGCFSEQLC